MDRQARLAADIGGTFTDVVLDAPAGRFTTKTLTASSAPERGVVEAAERHGNVRWRSLKSGHEAEIIEIKRLIETTGQRGRPEGEF